MGGLKGGGVTSLSVDVTMGRSISNQKSSWRDIFPNLTPACLKTFQPIFMQHSERTHNYILLKSIIFDKAHCFSITDWHPKQCVAGDWSWCLSKVWARYLSGQTTYIFTSFPYWKKAATAPNVRTRKSLGCHKLDKAIRHWGDKAMGRIHPFTNTGGSSS